MSDGKSGSVDNLFGPVRSGPPKETHTGLIYSLETRVIPVGEEKSLFDDAMQQSVAIIEQAHFPVTSDDHKRLSMALKLIIEDCRGLESLPGIPKYSNLDQFVRETAAQFAPDEKYFVQSSPRTNIPHYFTKYEPTMTNIEISWQKGDGKIRKFFLFPVPDRSEKKLIFGAVGGYIEVFNPQDERGLIHIEPYREQNPQIIAEFKEKIVAHLFMSQREMALFTGEL